MYDKNLIDQDNLFTQRSSLSYQKGVVTLRCSDECTEYSAHI